MFQRNWSPKLHFRESWEVNRISGRMDYEKILLTKFLSGKPTWLLQENCIFIPLMNLSTFLSSLWASLWLYLICCYSFLKHESHESPVGKFNASPGPFLLALLKLIVRLNRPPLPSVRLNLEPAGKVWEPFFSLIHSNNYFVGFCRHFSESSSGKP